MYVFLGRKGLSAIFFKYVSADEAFPERTLVDEFCEFLREEEKKLDIEEAEVEDDEYDEAQQKEQQRALEKELQVRGGVYSRKI